MKKWISKKMKRKFILLMAIGSLAYCFTLCSCNPCDTGYQFESDGLFGFKVIDRTTKEPVLHIRHTWYNYDTVAVYNENWDNMFAAVDYDGVVGFIFIDRITDKGVIDQLITRRFFMYFNYQDIDTIDIAFKMRLDECNDQRISYFKVAYNDSVYYDAITNRVYNGLSFIK
jgi:hypothetical protein